MIHLKFFLRVLAISQLLLSTVQSITIPTEIHHDILSLTPRKPHPQYDPATKTYTIYMYNYVCNEFPDTFSGGGNGKGTLQGGSGRDLTPIPVSCYQNGTVEVYSNNGRNKTFAPAQYARTADSFVHKGCYLLADTDMGNMHYRDGSYWDEDFGDYLPNCGTVRPYNIFWMNLDARVCTQEGRNMSDCTDAAIKCYRKPTFNATWEYITPAMNHFYCKTPGEILWYELAYRTNMEKCYVPETYVDEKFKCGDYNGTNDACAGIQMSGAGGTCPDWDQPPKLF
ncbi:hypothetical protein BGZ60DRAFT_511517 [Tricladium varicosporioides]|nr:hypothetical protein BGZ60DRAFT_511517 [Hymenoscyphus varicosporioides]